LFSRILGGQTNKQDRMYSQKINKQKAPVSDAATMSASKMFDYLLNSVKSSNLNFHIQQTPFSAVISIKKTLIKDQFGQSSNPPTLDSNTVTSLKEENHDLCDRIVKLEHYATSLKNNIEDEIDGNAKEMKELKNRVEEKRNRN
jgi:hypothetical protein